MLIVAVALAASGGFASSAAAGPALGLRKFEAHLVRASVPGLVRADQGPARVSVRTRKSVSSLVVEVNGSRHKAIRVVRRGRLRWRVILPRRVLDGGLNAVAIVARLGGRWGAAYPSFQYLFPRRGLVRVLSPRPRARARGLLSQTLALKQGVSIRAWLNGHVERGQVHPAAEVLVHGQLRLHFVAGIPLGLHFGKNRLVVMATRGRFYTRVVRVVRLINSGLLLGEGTPTTNAPTSLVQVQTQVSGGVDVGGTVYPDPDPSHNDAAEVFVFDRQTLDPIASRAFTDLTPIQEFIQQERQQEADPIVIIQTRGLGGETEELGPLNNALSMIGVRPIPTNDLHPPNYFVAIGGPGLPPGTGTQSCVQRPPGVDQTRCAIKGYFFSPVSDSVPGNYIFEPGQYVHFSVLPTPAGKPLTNTITVGDQSAGDPGAISASLPAGSGGGYHVAVLDRYTLGVLSNETFNTGDPVAEGAAEQALRARLGSVVSNRQRW